VESGKEGGAVGDDGIGTMWARRPRSLMAAEPRLFRWQAGRMPYMGGGGALFKLRDEEFDEGGGGGGLADPEEEHPFDDFGFELGHFGAEFGNGGFDLSSKFFAVLIGHEPLREVSLLLAKGDFEALRDGAGLGWLDAGGFEDGEDFDRAHRVEGWWKVWGMSRRGARRAQEIGDRR
jgi:hypothetical protein